MTHAARMTPFVLLAALGLSCQPERASAPDAVLSANLSGKGGNADCRTAARDRGKKDGSVALRCTIELPGNPITSTGKSWVDQPSGTYYLADRSNAGLFVIDIASHTVAGLIGGFEGGGGANGVGPSSITEGREGKLWVSDGNSMVRVVDQRSRQIIASVSTAIDACGAACNRTNEIAFDPSDGIVLVSNPSPAGTDGYLTFISAKSYEVLGHLSLGEGTLEGHVWVPQLQRFIVPMQNPPGGPFHAVVNPKTMQPESFRQYDCADIPGAVNTGGNNNLQLGSHHHLLSQLCGVPVIIDVRTGEVLHVISEVGTGDQDWYNHGDDKFYVFGQAPPGSGAASQSLGVIDAKSGAWLQNVPLFRGAYPAAWTPTNELLARVTVTAAMVADPTTDNTACVVKGRGCVVVFTHADN